jgi:hypothetical protein
LQQQDGATHRHLLLLPERPVAGRDTGLAEAVLRVNAHATQQSIKSSLLKAVVRMATTYSGKKLYCNITANCVLFNPSQKTYSVYFGQRFSTESKHVYYISNSDVKEDDVTGRETTYHIDRPTDVELLPTRFSTEHFGDLFKKTFASSQVHVHSVVNIIYKFTIGLAHYDTDKETPGQKWIRLF